MVLPRSGPMGVFSDLVFGLPVIYPQTWLSALSMYSCLMSWQFLALESLAALPMQYPRYWINSSVVGYSFGSDVRGSKVLGANIQANITVRLQHAMAYMGNGA